MSNKLSLASSQRVDFASLFTAEGYEIESIIGTTYSLNYETLLMLILAVTYGPGADKALEHRCENISPAAIFAAIKNMRGKLKVYCQADKTEELSGTNNNENMQRIKVLLDEFVEPIPMTKRGEDEFSSFHSKAWLISFKKKNHKYRMIVTSRNLTSNRDFDAVAVFESSGTSKACVTEILKQINPPEELKNQFKNICFEPEPQKITEDVVKKCHSVISPFLDASLLEKFSDLNIFSLRSEINKVWKVNRTLLEKHHFYYFNPTLEMQVEEGVHSSIHAKLYISKDFIILGSSNFTTRGWERNREFNIKLSSGIEKERLKEEFGVDKDGSGMFIPYQAPKSEDVVADEVKNRILQELACIQLKINWEKDKKNLWLSLEYPDNVSPKKFEWKPLWFKGEWKKGNESSLSWNMDDVRDVSKIFLCRIKVTENGKVTEKVIQMLAVWENEPEGLWEERYNAERSKLSLADELDFRMLSIEPDELYGRDVPLKRNGGSDDSHSPPRPPVFERLLKATPEQLKTFFDDDIIKRKDEEDPLGLVQAFEDLKCFFGIKSSGGKK